MAGSGPGSVPLVSALSSTSIANDILGIADRTKERKVRTLNTARPQQQDLAGRTDQVKVGLLGDSLIERMSTTGQWETLQPWPSQTMLPDASIAAINTRAGDNTAPVGRISGAANLGCGGDKIEHVLYRVMGDTDNNLDGLGPVVRPKLWIIHAGTNNLNHRNGFSQESVEAMHTLIRALHRLTKGGSGARFLLTGLFYRRDVPDTLVDQANLLLGNLISKLRLEFRDGEGSTEQTQDGRHPAYHKHSNSDASVLAARPHTFEFLKPPPDMPWDGAQKCFDDHVHLNEEGYRRWMATLLPKVEHMMRFAVPLPYPYNPGHPTQHSTQNVPSAGGNNTCPSSPAGPSNAKEDRPKSM